MKNWKKWLMIDKELPRSSYILRIVVGGYLLYSIWKIADGFSRPEEVNIPVITVSIITLAICTIICFATAAYGLLTKQYSEEGEIEEENSENSEITMSDSEENNK